MFIFQAKEGSVGVEYKHFLLVEDLGWIGDQEAAVRVHELLQRWGLADAPPTLFSLDGGKKKKLKPQLGKLKKPPANLRIEYETVDAESMKDEQAIERIMGPSFHDEDATLARYFQSIALVVGTDYRIHEWSERTSTKVIEPAMEGGKAVGALRLGYAGPDDCAEVYPASASATAPKAKFSADRWPAPKKFSGVWRSGLVLDCGKDLPGFMEKSYQLPGKDFTKELAKAFGTKLVQLGHFY